MTPEWEILRSNASKIVSLHLVSRVVQMIAGQIEHMNPARYKRPVDKVNSSFYMTTRALDVLESLVQTREMTLFPTSRAYLDDILQGKYGVQELSDRSKERLSRIEADASRNEANLIETLDLQFLNDWLVETIRKPSITK